LKLRKVICTEDSIMIQERQHRMEFQLIEVMKKKLQSSEFVSILKVWTLDTKSPESQKKLHSVSSSDQLR
jgi:hypothetical protein